MARGGKACGSKVLELKKLCSIAVLNADGEKRSILNMARPREVVHGKNHKGDKEDK